MNERQMIHDKLKRERWTLNRQELLKRLRKLEESRPRVQDRKTAEKQPRS